jgi:RNA polymerase sigma factor (sigma-70 family)
MTAAPDPSAAIARVMAEDRGRLTAALIARLRDFQLAEDVLQEAVVSALEHWGRSGLPASPQGWLLKVALRKAIDRMRGAARAGRLAGELAVLARDEADDTSPEAIADERLRLIFTCCHPALEEKSRVALTLRTLGGLTTPQIAAVYLDQDATMGQRLSRARAKIASAGIPFAVPGPEQWGERLGAVLKVIYLIFTAGYTAGPEVGRDLADEALYLARMVDALCPGQAEVEGLAALLCLTHARRAGRAPQGTTVPPAAQDRGLWDQALLAEGRALLAQAVARAAPGPFQIKAAIAALHAEDVTDWRQIAALYGALHVHEPSPVVRLNAAVAVAEDGDPELALRLIDGTGLEAWQPFHAARAHVLALLGRRDAALAAYDRAIAMADREADARFLRGQRARLLN